MNVLPIPFLSRGAAAIQDGRKTQTRRPVKPQPGTKQVDEEERFVAPTSGLLYTSLDSAGVPCPFGQPGDLLWVQEPWRAEELDDSYGPIHEDAELYAGLDGIRYQADGAFLRIENSREASALWCEEVRRDLEWRGQKEMPRWASRLTLVVEEVRVERVQYISDTDADAEGIEDPGFSHFVPPRDQFSVLWDSIYSEKGYGWDANPWVWVVTFRPIRANVDAVLETPEQYGLETTP